MAARKASSTLRRTSGAFVSLRFVVTVPAGLLSAVSSYGSAIGSSGDRPDAIADLMGIILNDGVRQPNVDLQRLHFAADTPYETDMTLQPEPQLVMAPEIAKTVR
jgi:hypothetical protein